MRGSSGSSGGYGEGTSGYGDDDDGADGGCGGSVPRTDGEAMSERSEHEAAACAADPESALPLLQELADLPCTSVQQKLNRYVSIPAVAGPPGPVLSRARRRSSRAHAALVRASAPAEGPALAQMCKHGALASARTYVMRGERGARRAARARDREGESEERKKEAPEPWDFSASAAAPTSAL